MNRTEPYFPEKVILIFVLREHGETFAAIAAELGCTRQHVSQTHKMWKEWGLKQLEARSGRSKAA